MKITKKKYEAFIKTLESEIEKIEREMQFLDVWEDEAELYTLRHKGSYFEMAMDYFANAKLYDFEDENALSDYANTISECYNVMTELSKRYCDGKGKLRGISESEWNKFEESRYEIMKQNIAYGCFVIYINGEEL